MFRPHKFLVRLIKISDKRSAVYYHNYRFMGLDFILLKLDQLYENLVS